jgi:tetratricopeptide (TPR) repeat protein
MNDPALYRILGKAYLSMRQYAQALDAYNAYLAAAPNDTAIKQQRDMIAELLRSR